MKKIFILMILFALLLSACDSQEPEVTATPQPATAVAPTEAPPAEPTAEPTEEITEIEAEANMLDLTALVEHPWQWTAFSNPAEAFDIELPAAYQLQFNNDGTVNIIADCNNASGNYTADGSSLTIEIGPMTLAACPPESHSDQFVAYLDSAANYFFEDGNLFIDLMADGGTMAFSPATVPDQLPGDGEGATGGELPEDLVSQLDAYLQSQVYTEGGNPYLATPGLVLYVETADGRYLKAAGVTDIEAGTPMQADDILQIGSNTKSLTIVLLMQLVEEGLLSLDDPLSQYLPDQAALLPNGDQITVRQMAQHTAGLWDYADDIIGAGAADPAAMEASYTPSEIIQFAVDNGSPYFAPGEEGQWHYSNTGYILLGMIIESITGETLSNLYQTHIFDPLGMESASFIEGVPQEGEITTNGYYWTADGEIIDATNWNGSQGWAAGAASMTAADLATYGKALAAGELFQNPDTLAEMLAFNPAATQINGGPYGLGLIDFAGDGTVWGHEGATFGFQSLWYTKPEDGIVVVALTNSGADKAYEFLNVLNILEGEGPLPVDAGTLLPISLPTVWQWEKFVSPVESTEIDETANIQLIITPDQSVLMLAKSPECGAAAGAYTVEGFGQISFELDDSGISCDADSLAGQLVQHLQDADSWHFDNGRLVIELPADGGSLIFDQ